MTLRRYAPLAASKGTVWPAEVRAAAYELHGGCIGPAAGMPEPCQMGIELDHIRASGAIGKKSRSTLDNAAPLCGLHHRMKTRDGRTWRPRLLDVVDGRLNGVCPHVEPEWWCPSCERRRESREAI